MQADFIDIYCERTGPEIWSEPLNALSNLAFIVTAGLLTRTVWSAEATRRDGALWVLVALVYAIGIGSGLFHTLAVRWAMVADVAPITLFTLAYSFLAFRRFVGLGVAGSLLIVVIVGALSGAIPGLTGFRGGSYVPGLLVMLGVGLFALFRRDRDTGTALLAAAAIFAASLLFRTIDAPLCGPIPIGTHFLWHLLNAVVLYVLVAAMARDRRRSPQSGQPT